MTSDKSRGAAIADSGLDGLAEDGPTSEDGEEDRREGAEGFREESDWADGADGAWSGILGESE